MTGWIIFKPEHIRIGLMVVIRNKIDLEYWIYRNIDNG